jgi:fucose 4-O-acetylase-like acetyltransferase
MELQLGSIIVHEADVALTDWLLAAECAVFALLLMRYRASRLQALCVSFFCALAAGSVLGGAYHAFFPLKTATMGGWAVWMGTMLSLGVTSVILLTLSASLLKPRWARPALVTGLLLLCGYAYWIMTIDHRFLIAIAFYAPMLALFMAALMVRFIRTKDVWLLPAADAVITMFVAAVLQQFEIGLHPVYFNHNALYHLLQGLALAGLFVTLRRQVGLLAPDRLL